LAFFTTSLQQPLDCPIADRARQTQKGMYVTHRLLSVLGRTTIADT
jgi:hypothetical protein